LTDVLAATSGDVVGLGTAVADKEKDNPSLDHQYHDTIWVQDERGWYHRYTHLYSFDQSVKLGGRVPIRTFTGAGGRPRMALGIDMEMDRSISSLPGFLD